MSKGQVTLARTKVIEKIEKALEAVPQFESDQAAIDHYLNLSDKNLWKIYRPHFLSWEHWDTFYDQAHALFPIRAFFQFTLPHSSFGFRRFKRRLHDWKWAFMHRYIKRHQYNVLRPQTLPPGYYDPQDRILHACMEELRKYYEYAVPLIDWAADPATEQDLVELTTIYKWWTEDFLKREEILDQKYPYPKLGVGIKKLFSNDPAIRNSPEVIEWKRISELRRQIEKTWAQEEEDMLVRLMKIRRSLWYP